MFFFQDLLQAEEVFQLDLCFIDKVFFAALSVGYYALGSFANNLTLALDSRQLLSLFKASQYRSRHSSVRFVFKIHTYLCSSTIKGENPSDELGKLPSKEVV